MKEIALTQGQTALIDDADFPLVGTHKWHAVKLGRLNKKFYAKRVDCSLGRNNKKQIFLHQVILPGCLVDHINGQTLDNRRSNLRPATHQQNCFNKTATTKRIGSTSRFKGVTWHKRLKKWQANICLNKRRIHIGYFDSDETAAQAYNVKAAELFGEFASLNVINPVERRVPSPLDFNLTKRKENPDPCTTQ